MRVLLYFMSFLLCSAISFVVHPESHYKKDKVLRYTSINPFGGITKMDYTVLSEKVNGEVTTITARSTESEGGKVIHSYIRRYYYDKDHWAEEVTLLSIGNMGMQDPTVTEFSDSLVYPYSMKVGDTLATARSYKKVAWKDEFVELSHFYYNRKVMERDTLHLPIGNIPVFRIEYKISSIDNRKHESVGAVNEKSLYYCSAWFSPEYGVVQIESTGEYGITRITLESIK
jgi:hypothetical protein